jgi:hypothetical protein
MAKHHAANQGVYFAYGALGLIDVTRDLWITSTRRRPRASPSTREQLTARFPQQLSL